MDRLGVDRLDLDHRGRRYFVHAYGKSPAVRRFLCSELMAQIARAALVRGQGRRAWDEVQLAPGLRLHRLCARVGYFGSDPGDAVVVPAGSIACFSSTLFHRSGPNTTDRMRRVYVAQYSAAPILDADGGAPRHLAEPVLIDGAPPVRSGAWASH